MNWYKIAQLELWKMPRNDYINWKKEEYDTMTPEEQDFYLREKNKKRKEWDRAVQNALSTGLTNLQEVDQLGWYGGGAPNLSYVRPLPQTLYHVTTNKNAVLKEGLKNRAELNQSMGIGLGGGDEETISFTTDLEIAQSIYRSLIEGKKVASGEISVSEMIQQASTGEGAKKPWIRDISNYYKKNPQELEEHFGGDYEYLSRVLPITVEEFNQKEKGEWEPVESGKWEYGNRNDLYTLFRRTRTTEEKINSRFDFFKVWSTFRESAGGNFNPLFFLSDAISLGKVPEEQIAILEYRSKPGAYGYCVSSLGEWRTWSGNAVELIGEVEHELV